MKRQLCAALLAFTMIWIAAIASANRDVYAPHFEEDRALRNAP